MMNWYKRILTFACCSLGLVSLTTDALSQPFPSKPVTIIVPHPAGSAGDTTTRVVAKYMQEALGQPFVIANRPGAQGTIGAAQAARSPADGYTMLVAAISFAAAVSELKSVPYDPVKDFEPVAMLGTLPLVLMVRPDFPAKDVPEFLARLKRAPQPLSAGYGSSSSRVAVAQLGTKVDAEIIAAAYRGIPLAMTDVVGGTVDFTFADLGNAVAQSKAGQLRALAVAGAERSPLMPDWPTLAEYVPGFDVSAWIAFVVPAGTPTDIAQRLHEAAVEALANPEVREILATAGITPVSMEREALGDFIANEVVRWGEMNRAAGIVPQ